MSTPQGRQPDDAYRAWLAESFAKAAGEVEAGATPIGEPVFGWRERTLSSRVGTRDGEFWLRVVSEQREWAAGEFWTGNVDANAITGAAKPQVVRHWEWDDDDRRLRAELMTLVGGHRCSGTPELRESVSLPTAWWTGLRASLEALATTRTQRGQVRQADVTARLEVFFGDRVADPTVSRWTAAHTDLHWANLLAPGCVLVDWEGWGLAPAGLDAASLYLHSLLQPAMAERVRAELGEMLEDRDGLISQLYVTGHLLLRINFGDYTDLAIPLHRNADRVIEVLRSPR